MRPRASLSRSLIWSIWPMAAASRMCTQQHPPRLCLYLPGKGEWTPAMRLDQTMVPWAILWLFYFEEWLGSNEWKGGGLHPGDNDDESGDP